MTFTVPAEERRGAEQATDLVEVSGLHPGGPTLVERAWLEQDVAGTRTIRSDPRGRVKVLTCDLRTGAPIDPGGDLSTDAYRPGRALAALVRSRDGHCRFPGCQVAARFCDLDHVRPWPIGPTEADNLMGRCRRHHRIKQHSGWGVVLDADGTVTWTDPAGLTRVTQPVHALHRTVLRARPGEPGAIPVGAPRTLVPDGPHTPLEFVLEHRPRGRWERGHATVDVGRTDSHDLVVLHDAGPLSRTPTTTVQRRSASLLSIARVIRTNWSGA